MPRIIGIDPGLVKTGWGIIDNCGNVMHFTACGLIKPDGNLPLHERLASLYAGIKAVLDEYRPDECAIEETFVNKNAMSSLKLGHARGALMLAVSLAAIPLTEYAATLVKKSVTGAGRAEKEKVAMMVKYLVPTATIGSEDEADALAVAICHAGHSEFIKKLSHTHLHIGN